MKNSFRHALLKLVLDASRAQQRHLGLDSVVRVQQEPLSPLQRVLRLRMRPLPLRVVRVADDPLGHDEDAEAEPGVPVQVLLRLVQRLQVQVLLRLQAGEHGRVGALAVQHLLLGYGVQDYDGHPLSHRVEREDVEDLQIKDAIA